MSRRERKRIERRRRRIFRTCIFIQIILLICGLLVVDFQIRNTLGIDEISLISYKQIEQGKYNVNIMGDSRLVDISTVKPQIYNKFAQLKEMTYSIVEWLKEKY